MILDDMLKWSDGELINRIQSVYKTLENGLVYWDDFVEGSITYEDYCLNLDSERMNRNIPYEIAYKNIK